MNSQLHIWCIIIKFYVEYKTAKLTSTSILIDKVARLTNGVASGNYWV